MDTGADADTDADDPRRRTPLSESSFFPEAVRTAISIASSQASSPGALAFCFIVLPLYLIVGGLDWISTVESVLSASLSPLDVMGGMNSVHNDNGNNNVIVAIMTNGLDVVVELVLYVLRHALLYLGLAKFVIEWGDGATTISSSSSSSSGTTTRRGRNNDNDKGEKEGLS